MKYESRIEIIAKNGTYVGKYSRKTEVCSFSGIPFGRAQRWEKAADVETTSEDRVMACDYGPSPWQDPSPGEGIPVRMDEDCLNLNLYGRELERTGKAVMVWIYGGAQVAGNNIGSITEEGEALFDGTGIVEKNEDILIVVPNYRVGIWGSLNLSVLDGYEERYAYSNNLARLDIVQCLRWIRENIEAFGGDRENITLFGQSAGSANISSLLLMPEARGLFKRVICQSSFAMDISLTSYEDSMTIAGEFFDMLHVKTVREAKALSPEELLKVQNEIVKCSMGGSPVFSKVSSKLFSPVIDGTVIPTDYWDYFMRKGCEGIDFLGGTNEGEYDRQFAAFRSRQDWGRAKKMLTEHCRAKLDPSYGGDPNIIPAYIKNGDTQRTVFEAYKDLKNDLYLRMGALGYGIVFARYGSSAYLYYLTLGGEERADGIRCPHGTEIPVVFRKGRDADSEISVKIQDAWYNFARRGNPGGADGGTWKQVGPDRLHTMKIGKSFVMSLGVRPKDTALLLPLLNEFGMFPEFKKICGGYLQESL